jgi:hypothetical protein
MIEPHQLTQATGDSCGPVAVGSVTGASVEDVEKAIRQLRLKMVSILRTCGTLAFGTRVEPSRCWASNCSIPTVGSGSKGIPYTPHWRFMRVGYLDSLHQRNFCGTIRTMTCYYVSLTEYGRASLIQKLIRLLCIVAAIMTAPPPAASGVGADSLRELPHDPGLGRAPTH